MDTISQILFLAELIVPSLVAVFLLIKFRERLPIIGAKKEIFQYSMMDEARTRTWHKIQKDSLKVMGEFVTFEYQKERYFVMPQAIVREKGIATSDYTLHNPIPINPLHNGTGIMSASETKEAIDSKVVFDLLRFTLSNVETGIMFLLIGTLIVGIINIYFGYTASSQISADHTLLQQVVHYLFPNSPAP